MAFTPKTVYIVSHTHWDREWYLTFHTFRVNLLDVVRQVLDRLDNDPSFRHFLLDGQSVILEDYLEIHPEDEGRIKRLAADGKLSIGPWYILPDEFLISAEAHVRNLLYGIRTAEKFGRPQTVGYMPDSFGHIAQMPQILRRGGLGSFVYSRGSGEHIEDTGYEYIWRAPDGSEVIALHQYSGYCSGGALGFDGYWDAHSRHDVDIDRAVEQVRSLIEGMADKSNGDIILINNGCDHLPPQQDFGKILDALRAEFPSTEFIHSGLEEYINAIRNAGIASKVYEGELICGKYASIIPGVWSARTYLKQKNDVAQNILTNYFEPLAAYAHFMHDCEYPSGLIDYSWKLLLKNHPHDSICGCSIDEVHRDMIPRFNGVIETANQSMINIMKRLAPTTARNAKGDRDVVLSVFNPLPMRRTEIIDRLVVLLAGTEPDALHIVDDNGGEVKFEVRNKWYADKFWEVDYRTALNADSQLETFEEFLKVMGSKIIRTRADKDTAYCFMHIRFTAELSPLRHALYHFTDKRGIKGSEVPMNTVLTDGNTIENEFCRVVVNPNGTFDLTDKLTGIEYMELNLLESTEDIGDEYDYSPCPKTETFCSRNAGGSLRIVEHGGMKGSIEASFDFPLPASVNDDRQSRSGEFVRNPVKAVIGLTHGSPVVDIDLKIENMSEDHRLRARFPFGIESDYIYSDGHYYVNKRTVIQPSGEGWRQAPSGTYPQQDFSLVQTDSHPNNLHGIALLSRGLHEVAPIVDEKGTGIALTLLRAVGWLSRNDFPTRNFRDAGPTIATPDAQCTGAQRFHYAVVPYKGDWVGSGIAAVSQRWRTPPIIVQGVRDGSVSGSDGLLETMQGRTSVTAIKKHESRDTLVIRLYNLTGENIGETLKFGMPVKAAWKVNLIEKRESEINNRDSDLVRVLIKPYEILGIEIEFS